MLKKLGFGLSANEKYQRAFEKGVLLGRQNWGDAVRLFQDATKEFEKHGDVEGARRATTNALLYNYLLSGQDAFLEPLIQSLQALSEIECIGSATETMPTAPLINELRARQAEAAIARLATQDPLALAAAHERARDCFAPNLGQKLITYAYLSSDPFTDTADTRWALHEGRARWYRAEAQLASDPLAAADEIAEAVRAFRRAGHKEGEREAELLLTNLRLSRTCWMCGREMHGQNVYYYYLPAGVRPYHEALLAKSNQDMKTLVREQGTVAVCSICRDLIVIQAQVMAEQMFQQLIQPYAAQILELSATVQRLSRLAHSHP